MKRHGLMIGLMAALGGCSASSGDESPADLSIVAARQEPARHRIVNVSGQDALVKFDAQSDILLPSLQTTPFRLSSPKPSRYTVIIGKGKAEGAIPLAPKDFKSLYVLAGGKPFAVADVVGKVSPSKGSLRFVNTTDRACRVHLDDQDVEIPPKEGSTVINLDPGQHQMMLGSVKVANPLEVVGGRAYTVVVFESNASLKPLVLWDNPPRNVSGSSAASGM